MGSSGSIVHFFIPIEWVSDNNPSEAYSRFLKRFWIFLVLILILAACSTGHNRQPKILTDGF